MTGSLRLSKNLIDAIKAMQPKEKPKTLAEMVDPKLLAEIMERQRRDARLKRLQEMAPAPEPVYQRLEDVPLAPGVDSGPYVDTGPEPGQATVLPGKDMPVAGRPIPEEEYNRLGQMHRTYFEILRQKRPELMKRALDPTVPDSDPAKRKIHQGFDDSKR